MEFIKQNKLILGVCVLSIITLISLQLLFSRVSDLENQVNSRLQALENQPKLSDQLQLNGQNTTVAQVFTQAVNTIVLICKNSPDLCAQPAK